MAYNSSNDYYHSDWNNTLGFNDFGDYYYELDQHHREQMDNLSWARREQMYNYSLDAVRCMLDIWSSQASDDNVCESFWDSITCWPATPANTTVFRPCPASVGAGGLPLHYSFSPAHVSNSVPMAHRTCTANGTWLRGDWTNYTLCVLDMLAFDEDKQTLANILRDIYFFGSIISAVLLIITLFIFSYFRTLQCNRISIHKNLVMSFIVRCTIVVIYLEPLVTNRKSSYRDKPWLCKLLTCLRQYSFIANIFWMFVEGLFLHNRVAVSVFNSEAPFRVFYAVGWGLPALIVSAWGVCLHLYHDDHDDPCWNKSVNLPYMWIIIVPIIIALLVNLIFLCNIIRILITKLRANNTVEVDQVRKAVKALAVLFPLLGTSNLLFFLKPQGETSVIVYRVTNAILQSSQGIFVSVIYCFMNSEVRTAIRRKWVRYKSIRMHMNGSRRRSSSARTSSVFLSVAEECYDDDEAPRGRSCLPLCYEKRAENQSIDFDNDCVTQV